MNCHILYHDNCFDGAASAAVFMRFYLQRVNPKATFTLFGMAHEPNQYFSDHLFEGDENIIVDFKYCRNERLTWWFDHHYSAFLTLDDETHFRQQQNGKKNFDPNYQSCTKLIANVTEKHFGFNRGILNELINWADIVDGAQYPNAKVAVEVNEPAQKLAAVVEANKNTPFLHKIIHQLSEQPLNDVAIQPIVLKYYEPLQQKHSENIRIIQKVARCSGNVTFFDLIEFDIEGHNKFIPYYLFPETNYHVSVMQTPQRTKISVGWNPWGRNKRKHNLAKICEKYGGGGHPVVAAISLPANEPEKTRQIAKEIAVELRT